MEKSISTEAGESCDDISCVAGEQSEVVVDGGDGQLHVPNAGGAGLKLGGAGDWDSQFVDECQSEGGMVGSIGTQAMRTDPIFETWKGSRELIPAICPVASSNSVRAVGERLDVIGGRIRSIERMKLGTGRCVCYLDGSNGCIFVRISH